MKRIQLTETELTRLIHRVINEEESITVVTHDELMDTIEHWCRKRDLYRKARGKDLTDTTSPKADPGARELLNAVKGYCNTIR
tara:strand:+ start:77 stop:325 length:249 start_codon:yes stop_codon:yes gene_type:complete